MMNKGGIMSENGEVAVVDETTSALSMSQVNGVDVEGAKEFMENYQELVEALLKDSDYQNIHTNDGVKKAKKKSAWRKLQTAFNISDDIIKEECLLDDNNQIIKSKFYVKATLPNGRSCVGVGVCSIFDKINKKDKEQPSNFVLRQRFSNAEHDVPSTAHTRAKSRAISDLIGAGEVSAEEYGDEEPVRVNRTRKNNSNNSSSETTDEKPKQNRRSRRSRKSKTDEAIPTKGEVVVEDDSTSSSTIDMIKEAADKNKNIKLAVSRIEEGEEELSLTALIDELYNLYDLGKVTIDEYYEAVDILK